MFRTEINLTPLPSMLHAQQVITLGSCFSEVIGNRLKQAKFNTLVNPFGTCYNPVSIHRQLQHALLQQSPSPEGYVCVRDIHAHYDFHSAFAALDQQTLAHTLQQRIHEAHQALRQAHWILITYGTAWVYERADNHTIVANCHKMPGHAFRKILLSQKRILDDFAQLHHQLQQHLPHAQILLTVSPVRHVKDTLQLNSVSKSVLRLSCQTLTETYTNVHYFPAFEIMLDDLRDYRFYQADLIHPNDQAEQYIWEKFTETLFDKPTQQLVTEWESLRVALAHRPFHPASEGHQRFLRDTLQKLEAMRAHLNVDDEINVIQKQLRA